MMATLMRSTVPLARITQYSSTLPDSDGLPLQLLLVAVADGGGVGLHHPVDLLAGQAALGVGGAGLHAHLHLALAAPAQRRALAPAPPARAHVQVAASPGCGRTPVPPPPRPAARRCPARPCPARPPARRRPGRSWPAPCRTCRWCRTAWPAPSPGRGRLPSAASTPGLGHLGAQDVLAALGDDGLLGRGVLAADAPLLLRAPASTRPPLSPCAGGPPRPACGPRPPCAASPRDRAAGASAGPPWPRAPGSSPAASVCRRSLRMRRAASSSVSVAGGADGRPHQQRIGQEARPRHALGRHR